MAGKKEPAKVYQLTPAETPKSGFFSNVYEKIPYPIKIAITGIAAAFTLIILEPAINVKNLLLGQGKKPSIAMMKGPQAKIPVPKENKILGSENFEKVELKDGVLYITNLKYGDKLQNQQINLRGMRKDIENSATWGRELDKFPEAVPKGIFGTTLGGGGSYLIYEQGIMYVGKDRYYRTIWSGDDSRIFTHDGAIFLAKDGSIVATTPTTLLVITSKEVWSVTYKKLFGDDTPNLEKPFTGAGKNDNLVDLRDSAINGSKNLKLEVQLSPIQVTVKVDAPSIGERR